MPNAFTDYYRCPTEFGRFDVTDPLTAGDSYFEFGGATCYGRRVSRAHVRDSRNRLPDLSDFVECDNGSIRLPFDLTEVATNLRHERYSKQPVHRLERFTDADVAKRVYYLLRPALPVPVRKHLQRTRLRGWERVVFPSWPVDFTVDTLMQKAMCLELSRRGIEKIPFIWFWPDGAGSCAILTHDVEHKAGRDFCDVLMDLDDAHGIKSSFQIVPEGRYRRSEALGDSIRSRGFEVNVHDLKHDGHLFRSRRQFLRRAERINQYAQAFQSRGFRSAAMYREQSWYDALAFSYDMSVPNVAHLEPQRGGCCTVMPYFVGHLLELPLTTIQDYSLFHILGTYSIDLWKKQIGLILAQNGLISVLTHPDYLIERRARAVYVELLAFLHGLRDTGNLWIALPSAVDRWWRSRQQMALVPDGTSWRIAGPECQRARVAYAAFKDGRLAYELGAAA
jgi:hypothetical protein